MPLLVQVYAPLPSEKVAPLSPPTAPLNKYREEVDRIIHVFGCTKPGCTGVRCLRSARRNAAWAKAGREKRRKAKEEAEAAQKKSANNPFARSTGNPFASRTSSQNNPFASGSSVDFGSMIFGCDEPAQQKTDDKSLSRSRDDSLLTEPVSISSSAETHQKTASWPMESSESIVPPRYLATDYERFSTGATTTRQAKLSKQPAGISLGSASVDETKEAHKGGRTNKTKKTGSSTQGDTSGSGEGWSQEAYEIMRVAGVEEVFLAFQERLETGGAPEQVIRYEFGGIPLPYSAKSKPYNLLWASTPAPGQSTAVTRGAYAPQAQQSGFKRYDARCSNIPRCPHCNSKRTFEMQLMPNLVTIIEKGLAQGVNPGKDSQQELGWATLWCFTCSADCLEAAEGTHGRDEDGNQLDWQGWREEVALVELED
jgi:pre-rRNA-processing protein TSR4